MSIFSPLFVICFDAGELAEVTAIASAIGYPDAQFSVGGVAEAVAALNARTSPPDYIIIDIGARGRDIFPELDEIAQHCDPRVRVAVIGSVNEISFYRELRARGVVEYSARPVQVNELRAALVQAAPDHHHAPANHAAKKGVVISCMSAASGDGASTVALNLAYCLAEEFQQPTVLIDMDYQFGLVAKSLDLTAPFGIRELFDHPERGLDDLLVGKMLVNYGRNLSIVASPNELRLMPTIRPEVIRELVAILRTKFAFVIIDVPHVWTDWTAATLSYSDHVTMVSQLWLRSLTHASRLLAAWKTVGISESSVSLVINRSGAKFKEAITAQDFERICRTKIDAYINNDVKAIVSAETQGKTLFEIGQNALLQQQIRQFAQGIVARFSGAGAAAVSGQGGSSAQKKSLLGMLGKKTT